MHDPVRTDQAIGGARASSVIPKRSKLNRSVSRRRTTDKSVGFLNHGAKSSRSKNEGKEMTLRTARSEKRRAIQMIDASQPRTPIDSSSSST
mmetsp:Transcript_16115/g.45126  ORF Transcript_16115/g.45126 Transcript_16115/m.45126 type:complete len:92 (+) Transcript_16115:554-829(+)